MHFFKIFILVLLFSTSFSYGDEFPPIPNDKRKPPAPVAKAIKDIANLCQLKTYKAKVARLKASIKTLEVALPHYISEGGHDYNVRHDLRGIAFLYNNTHMQALWEDSFDEKNIKNANRFSILKNYLTSRVAGYRLPSKAGEVDTAIHWFFEDWEHDVYRGFYCFDFGHPPPPYKRVNRDY